MRETDFEISVSPTASNQTPSLSVSPAKSRNGDVTGHEAPIVNKSVRGRQNGELATRKTSSYSISSPKAEYGDMTGRRELAAAAKKDVTGWNGEAVASRKTSSLLISSPRSENIAADRRQEMAVAFVGRTSTSDADAVRQNGAAGGETRRRPTPVDRRERETQIRSLLLDDDDDEDEIPASSRDPTSTKDQASSGAQVFALNRPHAWHHDLATKKRQTATDEAPPDRQVQFGRW